MLQPDLGTGTVMVGTCIVMIFISGARISHFVGLGLIGVAGFVGLDFVSSVPDETDYIFSGSMGRPFGKWVSNDSIALCNRSRWIVRSRFGTKSPKIFLLTRTTNRFYFCDNSEELGFIGGSLVLLLFALMLWRGIRIALGAPDLYGSLVAVGIIGMVAIQVMINIGVVTGLMPVTGITLPLLSYGGSH